MSPTPSSQPTCYFRPGRPHPEQGKGSLSFHRIPPGQPRPRASSSVHRRPANRPWSLSPLPPPKSFVDRVHLFGTCRSAYSPSTPHQSGMLQTTRDSCPNPAPPRRLLFDISGICALALGIRQAYSSGLHERRHYWQNEGQEFEGTSGCGQTTAMREVTASVAGGENFSQLVVNTTVSQLQNLLLADRFPVPDRE